MGMTGGGRYAKLPPNMVVHYQANESTLKGAGNLPLATYHWAPSNAPKAVVQVAHGMAEHSARYGELARFLNAADIACFAHDHRGHGKTARTTEELGHMGEDSFRLAVSDVLTVNRHLEELHPGVPVILLGHSMGSFMVQRVIIDAPTCAKGFVLGSTNGKPPPIAAAGRGVARLEKMRLGAEGRSTLLTSLSFGDFNKKFRPNRTESDWLSRDEDEVDAYIDDPHCGMMVSTQTWVDLLDALGPLTTSENLARIPSATPILLLSGTRDAVGDMGKGVEKLFDSYRKAGLTQVKLESYQGARHELFHELNRNEVFGNVVRWCDAIL